VLNLKRYFAGVTVKAGGAVTQKTVVPVNTGTAIGTRRGIALMDILSTVSPIVTSRTLARICGPQRHVGASTTVQARARRAFINVGIAVDSVPPDRTLALVEACGNRSMH
jgi:hypothetical protein